MPDFIKNFVDWFKLKPKLDQISTKPPFVKESQIWWSSLGENIGTEISGKSGLFTRPVIILKKLSKYQFLVVPTSSQIKTGTWLVYFTHKHKEMVACLHQVRVIDYRRLTTLIGSIDQKDYDDIKIGFWNLYQ